MVYTSSQGVVVKDKNKLVLFFVAISFAIMSAIGMFLPASATHGDMLDPFTQDELDTNWGADRFFPTGGVTSVSDFGRDNVARIGVDSEETQPGTFQRTEGIKSPPGPSATATGDFGNEVHVDLYVDEDWEDTAMRAGFWVVGDDGDGNRDELFGIVEFVNLELSTSGDSAQGNHEGWRYWDSTIGWTNLTTDFEYGEWVTLGIELDTDAELYRYSIDDTEVATAAGGENFIRELFLNSYNYGLDEFPNLNNDSYAAHWHVGEVEPAVKDDCKNDGWMDYGFRNQGQCIRFVNTGQDSR